MYSHSYSHTRFHKKISKRGNTRKASRPTASFAVRLRHQEICFERSPSEPKTLRARIVRAQWSAKPLIARKAGISRHSEHVVARTIFPVKTAAERRSFISCKSNHYAVGEAEKYASSQSVIGETKMASAALAATMTTHVPFRSEERCSRWQVIPHWELRLRGAMRQSFRAIDDPLRERRCIQGRMPSCDRPLLSAPILYPSYIVQSQGALFFCCGCRRGGPSKPAFVSLLRAGAAEPERLCRPAAARPRRRPPLLPGLWPPSGAPPRPSSAAGRSTWAFEVGVVELLLKSVP
jgi:hypothetical protein